VEPGREREDAKNSAIFTPTNEVLDSGHEEAILDRSSVGDLMKRLVGEIILIVCGSLAAAIAQNLPPSRELSETAKRAELARLEDVWNQAHLRGDAEMLERISADDLGVAVPEMPVWNKAELVAFVRSGRMKFSRYETSDLHIRTYGSAVVTGPLQRSARLATAKWMRIGVSRGLHPRPRRLARGYVPCNRGG
jgi:hypothetical protein